VVVVSRSRLWSTPPPPTPPSNPRQKNTSESLRAATTGTGTLPQGQGPMARWPGVVGVATVTVTSNASRRPNANLKV
jgi:hypothetical protein